MSCVGVGCGGGDPGAVKRGPVAGGWRAGASGSTQYAVGGGHLRRLFHTFVRQQKWVERTKSATTWHHTLRYVDRGLDRSLDTLPFKPLPCVALSGSCLCYTSHLLHSTESATFCHVAPQEARLGFNLRSLPGHSPQLAVEAVRRAAAAARVNATVSITKVGAGLLGLWGGHRGSPLLASLQALLRLQLNGVGRRCSCSTRLN